MRIGRHRIEERHVHLAFEVNLWFKVVLASVEMASGIVVAFFRSKEFLMREARRRYVEGDSAKIRMT